MNDIFFKIISGVLVAMVLWLGSQTLKNNDSATVARTYQLTILERLKVIETKLEVGIADRYTGTQARVDKKEMKEEIEALKARIRKLERSFNIPYQPQIPKGYDPQ